MSRPGYMVSSPAPATPAAPPPDVRRDAARTLIDSPPVPPSAREEYVLQGAHEFACLHLKLPPRIRFRWRKGGGAAISAGNGIEGNEGIVYLQAGLDNHTLTFAILRQLHHVAELFRGATKLDAKAAWSFAEASFVPATDRMLPELLRRWGTAHFSDKWREVLLLREEHRRMLDRAEKLAADASQRREAEPRESSDSVGPQPRQHPWRRPRAAEPPSREFAAQLEHAKEHEDSQLLVRSED